MELKGPYLIEWIDASSHEGHQWRDEEDVAKLDVAKFLTVGWVFRESEDGVIVVSTHNPNNGHDKSYWGELAIPKGCIVKKTLLRSPRGNK